MVRLSETTSLTHRVAYIDIYEQDVSTESPVNSVLGQDTLYGKYIDTLYYRQTHPDKDGLSFSFDVTKEIYKPYIDFTITIYNPNLDTINLFAPSNVSSIKTTFTSFPRIVSVYAGYSTDLYDISSTPNGSPPRYSGLPQVVVGEIYYPRIHRSFESTQLILSGSTFLSKFKRKALNVSLYDTNNRITLGDLIYELRDQLGKDAVKTSLSDVEQHRIVLHEANDHLSIRSNKDGDWLAKITEILKEKAKDLLFYFHNASLYIESMEKLVDSNFISSSTNPIEIRASGETSALNRKSIKMFGVPSKTNWEFWSVETCLCCDIELPIIGSQKVFAIMSEKAIDFELNDKGGQFFPVSNGTDRKGVRGVILSISHSFSDESASSTLQISTTGLPVATLPVRPALPYIYFKSAVSPKDKE